MYSDCTWMKKELRAELPEALRAEARAALLLRLLPAAPRGVPLEVPLGIFRKKNFLEPRTRVNASWAPPCLIQSIKLINNRISYKSDDILICISETENLCFIRNWKYENYLIQSGGSSIRTVFFEKFFSI